MKTYKIVGCPAYQRIAEAQGNEKLIYLTSEGEERNTFVYYHLQRCDTCAAIHDNHNKELEGMIYGTH